jgi:hypothetical protein
VLSSGPAAAITIVEDDVDDGALGVLLVGLVAATIEVEEDIDGGIVPPLGVPIPSFDQTHMDSCKQQHRWQ